MSLNQECALSPAGNPDRIEAMSCNLSLTTYTEPAKGCISTIPISKFHKAGFYETVEKKLLSKGQKIL